MYIYIYISLSFLHLLSFFVADANQFFLTIVNTDFNFINNVLNK